MEGSNAMRTQTSGKPISPVYATLRATPDGPDGIHNESNEQLQATIDIADPTTQGPNATNPQTSSPDKATKPSVTIPMNRMNSQTFTKSALTPSSAAITPSSTTSSRRNSRQASLANLIPTRPAPPSPISNPSSRRVSRALSTASSTHSTQRSPSHKNSSSSIRKSFANEATGASGQLKVSSSRRQSTLAISFTAPVDGVDGQKEFADSPQEAPIELPVPEPPAPDPPAVAPPPKILDPLSTIGGEVDPDDTPLRRNFSSTSASTSGASTTSSSSNPVLRHAHELELAYGILPSSQAPPSITSIRSARPNSNSASGTHTPLFSTRPRSIIQSMWGNRTRIISDETDVPPQTDGSTGDTEPAAESLHDTVSKLPPPKDATEAELEDAEWVKAHPILVKDFGFDEDDERFNHVPVEALLIVLRPSVTESTSSQRRGNGRGFSGRGSHFGGAAQYGGRWAGDNDWYDDDDFVEDEEDEEDDDGWGFPMGTVSGGPAPLGTTLLGGKRSRRELKNRSRAWGGLGASRSVGGKVHHEESSEAEGESSGFYEEEATGERAGDEDDDDLYGFGAQHTPSRTYNTFMEEESEYTHVDPPVPAIHPHVEVDGVDADDDEGDSTDYEDVGLRRRRHEDEVDVKPGVYRVLYSFDAEGPAEMSIAEGQTIRVLGQSGEGWAIAIRPWSFEERGEPWRLDGDVDGVREEEHGLVPFGFLEVFKLDDA